MSNKETLNMVGSRKNKKCSEKAEGPLNEDKYEISE